MIPRRTPPWGIIGNVPPPVGLGISWNEWAMDLRLWRVLELIKYEKKVAESLGAIYSRRGAEVSARMAEYGRLDSPGDESHLAGIITIAILGAYSEMLSALEPALADTARHEFLTAMEQSDAWNAYSSIGTGNPTGIEVPPSDLLSDLVLAGAGGWVLSGMFKNFLRDGVKSTGLGQIFRARPLGQDIFDLSRTVRGTFDRAAVTATTLGRTAIHRVSGRYNTLFHSRNKGMIKKQKYTAVFDSRTCQICGGYDGSVFKVGVGPTLPVHESCRCQYIAIWEKADDPDVAVSIDGSEPPRMTYHDWLTRKESQMPGFARDILGATRYDSWRAGRIRLSDLTRSGKIRTLTQLGLEKIR